MQPSDALKKQIQMLQDQRDSYGGQPKRKSLLPPSSRQQKQRSVAVVEPMALSEEGEEDGADGHRAAPPQPPQSEDGPEEPAEKTPEELEAEAKKVEIVDSTVMRVVFKNQEISHVQLVKEVRRQVPKSRAVLSVSDVEAGLHRLLTKEREAEAK